MFGERYFATRERLMDVMRGVRDLARDCQAAIGPQLTDDSIQSELSSAFLFVVCGEVNAGKSTLLNGLLGHDLCKVNILPETNRVLWYRHGTQPRDVEVTSIFEERYRPLEVLKNFQLVDTPGTNSSVRGHDKAIEQFLPIADLLLFVFPVSNPWEAATWDFISRVPVEALKRVVFVVQQIDQREPADIPVILGHMRDLSMKRLGHIPRIFAVSGKLALEAKKTDPFGRQHWEASGYTELEDFISDQVCQSPQRRQLLDTWRQHTADALSQVEERIEETTRAVDHSARFLADIEREIEDLRDGFVDQLRDHLASVTEVFQNEATGVAGHLKRRLGAWRTMLKLFSGDRTGAEVESLFIERLQAAVEQVAREDVAEIGRVSEAHWASLGDRVYSEMGIKLDGVLSIRSILEQASEKFVKRLGRATRLGIGNLKVRHWLEHSIRERAGSLKALLTLALFSLLGAGISGAMAVTWIPWTLVGVASIFSGLFTVVAANSRREIVEVFKERELDACEAFASALRKDYTDALRVFFQDYSRALEEVRRQVANEKLALEPRLKQWNALFLSLKAIEQDL